MTNLKIMRCRGTYMASPVTVVFKKNREDISFFTYHIVSTRLRYRKCGMNDKLAVFERISLACFFSFKKFFSKAMSPKKCHPIWICSLCKRFF